MMDNCSEGWIDRSVGYKWIDRSKFGYKWIIVSLVINMQLC